MEILPHQLPLLHSLTTHPANRLLHYPPVSECPVLAVRPLSIVCCLPLANRYESANQLKSNRGSFLFVCFEPSLPAPQLNPPHHFNSVMHFLILPQFAVRLLFIFYRSSRRGIRMTADCSSSECTYTCTQQQCIRQSS